MKQPKDYPMGRSAQVLFMQNFIAAAILIGVIVWALWGLTQ